MRLCCMFICVAKKEHALKQVHKLVYLKILQNFWFNLVIITHLLELGSLSYDSSQYCKIFESA